MMRKRSGSVSGPLSGSTLTGNGDDSTVSPVSNESLAYLTGIDYKETGVFEEIRDDILDVIKHFGDRYDIRLQLRSPEHAMFILSDDTPKIFTQIVQSFSKRPEFSVKLEEPPDSLNLDLGQTVIIYRAAKPPLTRTQKLKKKAHLITGLIVSVMYLYYIGTW